MAIIDDMHGKSPIVVTFQIPASKWYGIIGRESLVDAVLDRIIHELDRLELKGDSMWKKS